MIRRLITRARNAYRRYEGRHMTPCLHCGGTGVRTNAPDRYQFVKENLR